MKKPKYKTYDLTDQVEYMGKWVPRVHFRAFVYSPHAEKLACSYEEYEELIASGSWFSTKEDALKFKAKKPKLEVKHDGTDG